MIFIGTASDGHFHSWKRCRRKIHSPTTGRQKYSLRFAIDLSQMVKSNVCWLTKRHLQLIHPNIQYPKLQKQHVYIFQSNIQLERTSQCVCSRTSSKSVISSPCLAASLEMLHPARSAASEIFHVWYWGTLQFMAPQKYKSILTTPCMEYNLSITGIERLELYFWTPPIFFAGHLGFCLCFWIYFDMDQPWLYKRPKA